MSAPRHEVGAGEDDSGALRPVIWTRAFEARYDSAWWLCMSFCACNKVSRQEFEREFMWRHDTALDKGRGALRAHGFMPFLLEEAEPVAMHLARTDRDYGGAAARPATAGARFFELPFRRELLVRTLGFYARSSTDALADDTHTRFCAECLKLGYHSIFHQLAALRQCPLHRCPLMDACPRCHSSTMPFRFGGTSQLQGFACGCGWQLWDGEWPSLTKTVEFRAKEAEAMAPLVAWTRSLADLGADFGEMRRSYCDRGDTSLEVYARIFSLLHTMQPFEGDLELFNYKPARHAQSHTLAPVDDSATDTAALRSYVAIHKAIRRHVERRVLKSSGDRAFRERLGGFLINLQSRSVVPDPFACLYTQAFALWRLRTECFAVQGFDTAPARMRTVPRLKEIIGGLAPVNPTMVAYALLAHYYRCVDTVLECVEVAMPWSPDGISQFQMDTAFVDNHWRQGLSFAPADVVSALDYATVRARGTERSLIFLPDIAQLGEMVSAYAAKVRQLAAVHASQGPTRRKRRGGSRINRATTEVQDMALYRRFVLEPLGGEVVKRGTLREAMPATA